MVDWSRAQRTFLRWYAFLMMLHSFDGVSHYRSTPFQNSVPPESYLVNRINPNARLNRATKQQ
jgi:hypothetical protein